MLPFPIIYESPWVLAVNKPPGLAVEKHPEYPSVEALAEEYVATLPGKNFVGIVHRLDRPVSGTLVLAKRKQALKELNAQFREKQVQKWYWALVSQTTNLPKEWTLLTHWLQKDPINRRAELSEKAKGKSVQVQLRYRKLEERDKGSLLEIELLTGKYHQIRAQLSAIGAPIIGDTHYGSAVQLPENAIALHARTLEFVDPFNRQKVVAVAPLSDQAFWADF